MAIRGGAVGVVALSLACALTAPTVRAQVLNGLSLVEYTRDWDGRTENYYAIGDAALVRGLEEADAYFSFLPAYFARDFLDEFVPIELKRWNNRAAKALMARIATGFYSAADPGGCEQRTLRICAFLSMQRGYWSGPATMPTWSAMRRPSQTRQPCIFRRTRATASWP
jgi:hypothetical protein